MRLNTNQQAFMALLRAGLWETNVQLSPFESINFTEILSISEEQAVVGQIATGIEYVTDIKLQKKDVLPFIGRAVQREQHNLAMNFFIGMLIDEMRKAGIYSTLIKGQGVAQCYARPEWRSAGDVDLFFDAENYKKAKDFLTPLAVHVDDEDISRLHLGMTIDPWVVELHGTMHTNISRKMDAVIDEVQRDIFERGGIRIWNNNGIEVNLPSPDNDLIIIFTHFLKHFYVGGIGLRQICDWCRLLWTYKNTFDEALLKGRLCRMGLQPEWEAFAYYAVKYLGMPSEAMPMYADSSKNARRASKINVMILEAGNFGHNKDESYRQRYPKLVEKTITFFRRFGEFCRLTTIFPGNALRHFITYVIKKTKSAF